MDMVLPEALDYVLKEAADSEAVKAIREVAGGGRYVHPELGARLVTAQAEERRRADADPLSEREHEVLRLLARGYTNQEIAGQLFISVRTAETHRAHVMQKAERPECRRPVGRNGTIAVFPQAKPGPATEAPERGAFDNGKHEGLIRIGRVRGRHRPALPDSPRRGRRRAHRMR